MRIEKGNAKWSEVKTVGDTPHRRYGHTITFSSPYLLLFGGIIGTEVANDSWCLNIDKEPFKWQELKCKGEVPAPRVYHSAAACQSGGATGMVVIFGGRSGAKNEALSDTWGIRRHRNGMWDWIKAPYHTSGYTPKKRFQHQALFLGSLMIIVGGRSTEMPDHMNSEIFDAESSDWIGIPCIQRFRHIAWAFEDSIFVHGGFDQDAPAHPISDLHRINLLKAIDSKSHMYEKVSTFIYTFKAPYSSPSPSLTTTPSLSPTPSSRLLPIPQITINLTGASLGQSSRSVVGESGSVGIGGETGSIGIAGEWPVCSASLSSQFLSQLLQPLSYLNPSSPSRFAFGTSEIKALCKEATLIVKRQNMLVRAVSPVKVFGDIHGQYSDLMRFFELWGAPEKWEKGEEKEGDIGVYDYLFLGDFVDRGSHSLETVCLLMALKVKYPDQIHLIRGNHEDRWININFGFYDECQERLDEDQNHPESTFYKINDFFDYLPLAALIDEQILCLHGGIGANLKDVSQIETIERPLEVVHEVQTDIDRLVVDILWSDPTDNDSQLGIQLNTVRDPQGTGNIVKFGPDIVKAFLKKNNLVKIIRAHECVMDGMERFAGGDLITVFSATDYCGKHKNAGAVLYLTKNREITPKLIYPQNLTQNNWLEDEEALAKRPPTPPRWHG